MKNEIFLETVCLLLCVVLPSAVYAINKVFLPDGCRFEGVSDFFVISNNEKSFNEYQAIMCDIDNDAYEFKFTVPKSFEDNNSGLCSIINNTLNIHRIVFRWTQSNGANILEERFNFTNLIQYFSYFRNCKWRFSISIWGISGIDVNFFDDKYSSNSIDGSYVDFSSLRLDFYHNKKRLDSCQDIVNLNLTTRIRSIFQLTRDAYFGLNSLGNKQNLCPLVFSNSKIYMFALNSLADTFYKKRLFQFSNETFPNLNSDIYLLHIYKVLNVNIDLNLLHPSVFNYTSELNIQIGTLNSINGEIFMHLKSLSRIFINPKIFRKINHKQGIEWIKKMNYDVNVNLSGSISESRNKTPFEIIFSSSIKPEIIPDEDFCIYVDYPFNQLVIFYDTAGIRYPKKYYGYSCTNLWLFQYYEYYYRYLLMLKDKNVYRFLTIINSEDYKSKSKCNFEERIRLCNKSNYHLKDIWDDSDFNFVNAIIQIALKISLYPLSLLGLVTNLIVIIVILHKNNSDLFKGFKQYSYLWLNSIFCIMILVIELFSWMTECFYPFEVFCLEIRKLVAIQLFKIIFHECLVTMFRLMCNFTYVAFALNRIGLIGREHGKLVTFMSELGIKRYIGVTLLISISLSWTKYFKYDVNYNNPNLNFPMSNEMDLALLTYLSTRFVDFYFTFNLITDLVNYFLFLIICLVIDICMVVQLSRVLKEKTKKSESMKQNKLINETKKAENEEAVNKAIKMVVLNSTIGVFFKLPVLFIPLINLYGQFYFKNEVNHKQEFHTNFALFYSMLHDSGFYYLFQDMSHLLFTLSLSIQIFIYNRFDKKFRFGYDRLKDKVFLRIKNLFKSNT